MNYQHNYWFTCDNCNKKDLRRYATIYEGYLICLDCLENEKSKVETEEYKDPDDREIPLSIKEQFIFTSIIIIIFISVFFGLITTATHIAQYLYELFF